MFALRGIDVALSVFVLVYCAISVAVSCTWNKVYGWTRPRSASGSADLAFALRLFPLITAVLITIAFAVPSFVLLEPHAVDEPLGRIPLLLAIAGIALGIFGVGNAALAMRKASRTITAWSRAAQPLESSAPVPVLRIFRRIPAMTAAGILNPKILLSSSVEFVLNDNEMQAALNHELAHIRRFDNLKKLLFRFVAFPGMRALENAWLEATEMAADDAAVFTSTEALDLAAALIKLSSFSTVEACPDLTAAFVPAYSSLMNARVERLVAWTDDRRMPNEFGSWYGVGALAATIAGFAITYRPLLLQVHSATEWLVR